MIRLYLADMSKSTDLWKAGTPPTGGGPKSPSVPKTPGAATGGSGPQVVDCPLGTGCPDGGRHQMGSVKLQEHTKQAQTKMQTGVTVGDESAGKESQKPGVPPGAANIGGVGSDQVKRTPPETPGATREVGYKTYGQELGAAGHQQFETGKSPIVGHDEDAPDTAQTLREFPAFASEDTPQEPPSSERKTLIDPVINLDPDKKRQNVPNPMVADEAAVPPNSKPMDHYKLAQVARDSGDEELAGFHEGMARKRTEGMGSEDHRKLAEDLNAEGMHEQAKYHAGIHQRVGAFGEKTEPTSEESKKHESSMRDVHHEARTKANADLEAAKKQHEETKAKADKIKASNAEKLKQYEEAKAEHAKKKEEAKNAKDKAAVKKVGKPPEKPKLEKEEKVPERPELAEPADDAEKLRHESHTDKAKRLADVAESHLKGNKNLSTEQRQRLERAHKMAVYHSNIGYTPTAAHKKELGDVESAMSGMGVKQHHDEITAAEDAKKTAQAAKQAEKDRAAEEKQKTKQAKAEEKAKTVEAKQQAKQAAEQPKPPQTDLDHARVADHKAKAQKLRTNIESHMAANPDMSPEEQQRSEMLLRELEKHEQLDMVPGSDHESELKELHKLAGDHGKQEYAPDTEGGGSGSADPGHNFAYNMLHQGRALGATAAASATNPYGQAGQLGTAVPSYGISGATSAGHHLLRDQNSRNVPPEPEPKSAEKRPQQSSMKATS